MSIEEGPGVGGTIGDDNGGDDNSGPGGDGGGDDGGGSSGPSVQPGDTVRIDWPGEPMDGVVGVVLDVVAVQPDDAGMLPYVVPPERAVKV